MNLPIVLAKAAGPLAGAALGVNHFLPFTAAACLFAAGLLWAARN